ncbi:hypothetical protein ACRAWD_13900 [Caulobacter segnis]
MKIKDVALQLRLVLERRPAGRRGHDLRRRRRAPLRCRGPEELPGWTRR